MPFNAEKSEEVVFSTKRKKPNHPALRLGDDEIVRKAEHKHIGRQIELPRPPQGDNSEK